MSSSKKIDPYRDFAADVYLSEEGEEGELIQKEG
jgi:hypothetical protein